MSPAAEHIRNSLRSGLFMISCPARTGSLMLVNYLQSHPQITCHMEIFNPARVEGFFGTYRQPLLEHEDYQQRMLAYRRDDPAGFLYKVAFDAQSRQAVGFKFKHEEFLLPRFARARDVLMRDTDIKIIWLRRDNLLKRYLSWHVANRITGVTMKREGEEKPVHPPVRLDAAACRQDFEETERRAALTRRMLAAHPIVEVVYERLAGAESQSVLNQLQRFIGVEVKLLTTVFAKLTKDNLRNEIENFDELRKEFTGTPYARFFEE